MRQTPNWNNYIMRKYGQSIRQNITEAYGVFARAVILVRKEKALDELMENLPKDKWRAA